MGDDSTAVRIEDRIAALAWQLVRRYYPVPYNEDGQGKPGSTGFPWLGACFAEVGTVLTALDLPGQPLAEETGELHRRMADVNMPATWMLHGIVTLYLRESTLYTAMDALYRHAQQLHQPAIPLREVLAKIVAALLAALADNSRNPEEMAQLQGDVNAFTTELELMVNEFLAAQNS